MALKFTLCIVAGWLVGLAVPARADAPRVAEPDKLEEGWNLPAPPLPPEALEGTTFHRLVKIRRSDGQPPTEAWLKAQLNALELDVDGRVTPLTRTGADFAFDWQAPAAGTVKAKLRARSTAGVREGPTVTVTVFANVRLKAKDAKIDFGAVPGGCAVQQFCKPVDFSASQQLRGGQKLAISRPAAQPGGGAGWPGLLVHVRSGAAGPLYPVGHGTPPILVDYAADQPLEVCYAAPRCQPVPDKTDELLLIQPSGKGLVETDRAAQILLSAAVAATPIWLCYLPWLAGLIALIVAIFIIVGVVKPHKFPQSAMLFVGSQENQLARDGGRPLYSAPGGRRGFYRSATCTFDASGMTVRKGTGGALVLHADGNEIRVEQRTTLEVKERQRWRVVPPEEKVLQRGSIHRVGKTFYFRID